jgi:hypothetical protein
MELIFACEGLQTLKLGNMDMIDFLGDLNIQLKTLELDETIFASEEQSESFFETQRSLTSVTFLPPRYDGLSDISIETLKSICQLPNLKYLKHSVWYHTDPKFEEDSLSEKLKGIKNESVETLIVINYPWDFEIPKTFNEMFPNLKEFHYPILRSENINLINSSINLDKLHIDCDSINSFHYQPDEIPSDGVQFEESLKSFMLCHKFMKNLKELTIGHECWTYSDASFKISLKFCKFLINKLSELTTLKLYNVAHTNHLEVYFEAHLGKLENITLFTSIGRMQCCVTGKRMNDETLWFKTRQFDAGK